MISLHDHGLCWYRRSLSWSFVQPPPSSNIIGSLLKEKGRGRLGIKKKTKRKEEMSATSFWEKIKTEQEKREKGIHGTFSLSVVVILENMIHIYVEIHFKLWISFWYFYFGLAWSYSLFAYMWSWCWYMFPNPIYASISFVKTHASTTFYLNPCFNCIRESLHIYQLGCPLFINFGIDICVFWYSFLYHFWDWGWIIPLVLASVVVTFCLYTCNFDIVLCT